MSKDKIATIRGISDSYLNIYSDGTYQYKSYREGMYSKWKIEDNALFYDHSKGEGWRPWGNNRRGPFSQDAIVKAINEYIVEQILLE